MPTKYNLNEIFDRALDEYGIATAVQIRVAVKMLNDGLIDEREAQRRIDKARPIASHVEPTGYVERTKPMRHEEDPFRLGARNRLRAPSVEEAL